MKGYKKILLGLVGFFLVFSMFASQMNRAEAGFPTAELMSVPTALKTIWEKRGMIITSIKNRIVNDLLTRNVAMYMDNLAYNTAMSLETGAPGSKPLHQTDSWGDVFKKTNEAAIGNFIGELTEIEDLQKLGLNLCNPSIRDVQFKLTIPLYLIDSAAPPKPKCNWSSIQSNWKNFDAGLKDNLLIVQLQPTHRDVPGTVRNVEEGKDNPWKNYNDFWEGFSYSQSDFGLFMEVEDINRQRQEDAERAKEAQIAACRDYIENETPVTKEVITTCSKIALLEGETAATAFTKTADKQAGELAPGGLLDNIGKIMMDAGNRFVNTYSSRLMNDWLKGGTFSLGYEDSNCTGFVDGVCSSDLRDSLLDRLRGGSNIRNPKDVKIARTNVAPNIAQLSGFSLIEDFSVCPPDADYRHPDNCVISTQFLSAVNSRVTTRQAINEGLLNGSLPLIGPDDLLRNLSADCYLTGLCHSNLSKLRKANIIPIGWEMAALRSPITSPITLSQAMDCFEDFDDGSGNCLFATSTDYMVDGEGHNPFYHLVDPNWVLKIPEVTCDAFIYSSVLESGDSSNRLQYCADVKTCLREDKDGNCLDGNYGYCTKSENIWSFDAKICEDGELYSGCLTFNNEEYGANSYIESSLDYCTSDEVGCQRYSQERNEDNEWVFDDIDIDDDDLFLNDKSNTCPSSEAGCNEYIVLAPDRGVNLLANSDFKDDNIIASTSIAGSDGIPDGWHSAGMLYHPDNDTIENGYLWGAPNNTTIPVNAVAVYQRVLLQPNTSYKISATAAQTVAGNPFVARVAIPFPEDALQLVGGGDCFTQPVAIPYPQMTWTPPPGTEMEKNECTFTVNGDTPFFVDVHVLANPHATLVNQAVVVFDNIKLEVVSNPNQTEVSVYSDYGDGGRVYMNDGAFMCSAEEVGCMAYRPTNGDPMIPAVANLSDICPAECVGYSTFAEELNNFDIIEGVTDVEYHNFIASSAQSCPLQEVGCDEFTNLDELARGGESTEYYSYLRQCVSEDDPRAAVYFTWEGSDVSGYQLKRWLTLQSNAPGIPGPCTNIDPGSNACTDNVNPMAICGDETPATILDDPQFDANCREFIDSNGNSFFRLQDQVVFASDECRDYRRSSTGTVYRAISSLSFSCAAENNGCRSYIGNTDNNLREVFSDNFENGSYSPWTSSGGLDMSADALGLNSHSLRADIDGVTGRSFMEEGIKADREYEVSFWMKSESVLDTLLPVIAVETPGLTYNIVMSTSTEFNNIEAGNWHYYKASIYISEADIGGDIDNVIGVQFELNPSSAAAGGYVYIDNVVLREVIKNTSVIKDSWVTPVSCDTPYTGYHLGCQAYVDINDREFNFKSFNSLCREEAVGCLPVIDTQNSTNPFEQIYNPSSCSDGVSATPGDCAAVGEIWTDEYSEITIVKDSVTYLVPSKDNYCAQHFKGCQALGLQSRTNPDNSSTVYKINDPDKYNSTLCLNEGLNCLDYNSAKGTYYFKDPMYNTCTYKKDVNIDDHIVSGWFSDFNIDDTTGQALGCSDTLGSWYDSGAFDFDDLDSADLALNCPSNKNLCTGFRDLNDPENCDPNLREGDMVCRNVDPATIPVFDCSTVSDLGICSGLPLCHPVEGDYCEVYYYYNDDSIDEGSCNGQVDQNGGCMLFSDENYWNGEHDAIVSLYDSAQTYSKNISTARPLSPIVCGDWDPNCNLDANRLINVKQDRQCGEWLSCKSSAVVLDPNTKSYRVICDEIGTCDKYSTDNNISTCANWVEDDVNIAPLSTELYQSRSSGSNGHITWNDYDYTGYSIPDMLPVSELVTYNFQNNSSTGDNTRLVYGGHNAEAGLAKYHTDCVDPSDAGITEPYNGDLCIVDIASDDFIGECDSGLCWVAPIAGETSTSTFTKEVRGYAVSNAPFPSDIASRNNRKSGYSGANICNINPNSGELNCEDDYIKVTYGEGGSVRYYSENDNSVLDGICLSGQTGFRYYDDGRAPDEQFCTVKHPETCNTPIYGSNPDVPIGSKPDGMCQEITKVETVNNWPGVCLDYDYSTPLIGLNGEIRYYCNQWYPVNKIQGTNSLYNNYREAGYYNEAGKDILYCAIAEPYTLSEDRIYCGGSIHDGAYCNLLLRVSKGTRVHMGSIAQYGWLLNSGYLDTETAASGNPIFVHIPKDDDISVVSTTVDYIAGTDYGMDNRPRIYFDRIEKYYIPGNNPSANEMKFSNMDFIGPNGGANGAIYEHIPTLTPSEISTIFDGNVEYYYFDEDVSITGGSSGKDIIDPAYGFTARWGPECDLNAWPSGWNCDDGTAGLTGGGDRIRYPGGVPAGEYHLVNRRQYDSNKKCHWYSGKKKINLTKSCNPLDHNYYVKAEAQTGIELCTQTDCSVTVPAPNVFARGRDCLYNDTAGIVVDDLTDGTQQYFGTYPTYVYELTNTTGTFAWGKRVSTMSNESECGGNSNCEYAFCTYQTDIAPPNPFSTPTHVGPDGIIGTGDDEIWCSDYGAIIEERLVVFTRGDSGGFFYPIVPHYFNNVTDMSSCLDRIFELEEHSIFEDPDINLNNIEPGTLQTTYNIAIPKDDVDEDLVNQLMGYAEQQPSLDYIDMFHGCISEVYHNPNPEPVADHDPAEVSCTEITKFIYSCTGGYWTIPLTCTYYPSVILGVPCDTLNGCYLSCGVVTELDSEGENSWVRTDIWWRSEQNTSEGRLQPVVDSPWRAYFYNVLNDDYEPEGFPSLLANYYNVEGQEDSSFTHFGGSIGSASDGLVVTKVDFQGEDTSFGNNIAAVFYHSTSMVPIAKENWNDPINENIDAARQLVWLFGRAYNLQWDNTVSAYVNPEDMVPASEIPHLSKLFIESGAFEAGYTIANPIMGDDYNPRIFKVCENDYCKIKDSVTGELLYNAEGITINNVSEPADGDAKTFVYGHGGTLFTAIKFYYHAHPDHMPIKNIAVDWSDGIAGDFIYNNSPGKYKNNLETCSDSADLPKAAGKDQTVQGFGGLDRACREGYKVLYHTYEYDEQHLCDGTQAWMPPGLDASDEVSCYQPKILVQDNWVQGGEVFFDGAVVVFKD